MGQMIKYYMKIAEKAKIKTPEEEEFERNKRELDALEKCIDEQLKKESKEDMEFLEKKICPNCKKELKSLFVDSETSKIIAKTRNSSYRIEDFGFYCERCEIIFRFVELSKFTKSKDY